MGERCGMYVQLSASLSKGVAMQLASYTVNLYWIIGLRTSFEHQ